MAVALLVPAAAVALTLTRSAGSGDPQSEVVAGSPPAQQQTYPAAAPSVAALPGTAFVARGAPAQSATLHDPATGDVVWQGRLPFDTPVVYPHVAALDDGTYVIAAVPCTTVEAMNDSGPDCSPGGVAVLGFDPGGHSFRAIRSGGLEGETPYVKVLGRTDAGLVLQVDGQIYRLPPGGGDLAPYPAPPLEMLSSACLVGDTVVAVEHRLGPGDPTPEPGQAVAVPSGAFVPFAGATLDLGSGGWTQRGSPAATYDANDTFDLGCTSHGIVAVPSERPMSAASPYVSHLLDVASGAWVDVPPPPEEFLAAAPPAADGDRLVLPVSSDLTDDDTAVLVFDAARRAWSAQPGGEGAAAVAVALTGDRLVSVADGTGPATVLDVGG